MPVSLPCLHHSPADSLSAVKLMFWTYFALLVRKDHVGVPDLKAVAELREMHFLDFHSEVRLQALGYLWKTTRGFKV